MNLKNMSTKKHPNKQLNKLITNHGKLQLPAFFPDATRGVVRGVDSKDLLATQTPGLVINTYHLLNHGLIQALKNFGGIGKFMNWPKPTISDSGGFQVMSLVRENPKRGTIRDNEIIFRDEHGKKTILTPEKCIQIQFKIGADIIMTLDDCTKPDDTHQEQEKSVDRTIRWAKKCRKEYDKLSGKRHSAMSPKKQPPLIFGIIQGGSDKKLRKECADELTKLNFDGYAYGGWPITQDGMLLSDILKYTAELMPDHLPKYAMGLGKPENIVECIDMGYNLFDCVLPTRDARHKRLYLFTKDPTKINFKKTPRDFYHHLYLDKTILLKDKKPISPYCDCYTCQNYSRAYLHNLFKAGDALSIRLATIHNLRFYSRLMELLQ